MISYFPDIKFRFAFTIHFRLLFGQKLMRDTGQICRIFMQVA